MMVYIWRPTKTHYTFCNVL